MDGWMLITALLLIALAFVGYTLNSYRKRLATAQKELTRLNDQLNILREEKNQLTAFVSHDLKSPLNRIFALVQLLSRSDGLSVEQRDLMAKMHQVIADMLLMIRNLQDDRKLSRGELAIHAEEVNISGVVASVLKNFRALMDIKHLTLEATVPPPILVKADRHYLTRVIENILSNAVKFSPAGKKIVVRLLAGETVRLEVHDEGPGISMEDFGRLFKKFTTLAAKPTGSESASGLGLFIAQAVSEKMGMRLRCEHNEKGATFSLTVGEAPGFFNSSVH
jgi:signal transduction histidine kinase